MRAICAVRLGAAVSALAAAMPAVPAAAATGSESFVATGEHAFVVPAGVTSVQVALVGGSGASGGAANSGVHAPGGVGATAIVTIAVSPGETLYAEVAGNGQTNGAGGYGGGGSALHSGEAGGGGGGASDVRTCAASAMPTSCGGGSSLASRLVVAAGGGGGARGGADTGDSAIIKGGAGGAAAAPGGEGAFDAKGDSGGEGGRPGGALAPGAAGANSAEPASAGQFGAGGGGGSSLASEGGGGGGGVYGGGGGGGGLVKESGGNVYNSAGGGGGGGGSGAPGSPGIVAGFHTEPTTPGAEPSVAFSWTLPAPAATTGPASGVTSAAATLNGMVNADGSPISDCHFVLAPAPPTGASVPCAQQVGAGSSPVAMSATIAGLAASTTYTVTLVAASPQGISSGAGVAFSTLPAGAVAPGATTTSNAAPLGVTNLRLTAPRFRRGRRPATVARAVKVANATTAMFALSEAASVELTFQRAARGVLTARGCAAPATAHRRGHACTRYVIVRGTVTRTGHAGNDAIQFDGVLDGGARLTPGSYRLSLIATAAGASKTAAQHPSFTVLGP
jgi:hypothetical protein